jgi:hypothetical protein
VKETASRIGAICRASWLPVCCPRVLLLIDHASDFTLEDEISMDIPLYRDKVQTQLPKRACSVRRRTTAVKAGARTAMQIQFSIKI